MVERDPLAALEAENARLIALLEQQGIAWRLPAAQVLLTNEVKQTRSFSTQEKVAIFRRLFRGRTDVYPLRWESRASGKAGYSPACANEWRAGVCDKPRIKCGDCGNRLLVPLTDSVIYDHLAGEHTVGVDQKLTPKRGQAPQPLELQTFLLGPHTTTKPRRVRIISGPFFGSRHSRYEVLGVGLTGRRSPSSI